MEQAVRPEFQNVRSVRLEFAEIEEGQPVGIDVLVGGANLVRLPEHLVKGFAEHTAGAPHVDLHVSSLSCPAAWSSTCRYWPAMARVEYFSTASRRAASPSLRLKAGSRIKRSRA